uniref:Putative secreted protein n=1 Tax=Ixodes ricinus TaxID=34613 RepID=A0A6B0UGZ8_IXORI
MARARLPSFVLWLQVHTRGSQDAAQASSKVESFVLGGRTTERPSYCSYYVSGYNICQAFPSSSIDENAHRTYTTEPKLAAFVKDDKREAQKTSLQQNFTPPATALG